MSDNIFDYKQNTVFDLIGAIDYLRERSPMHPNTLMGYLRRNEIPGKKVRYGFEMDENGKIYRSTPPFRGAGWRILQSDLDKFLGEKK